jgi:RimJ/RimL family protein N-acetyltransferase
VTGEVELREPIEADLETLYRHQADPEASAMAAFPARDRAAFLAHHEKVRADPTTLSRTIVVDGDVVGSIGSWEAGDERDVGYSIGREHWGKGYATAGLRAFLGVDGHRPLHVHVAEHNVASQRVLEKSGFVFHRTEQHPDVVELVFVLPAD